MKDATLTFNGGYDMKDAMLIADQSICNEKTNDASYSVGKIWKICLC